MKYQIRSYRTLAVAIMTALLIACGGSQPPVGVPSAMPQSRTIAAHAQRGGSWMLPEASGRDLVYVAGWQAQAVFVYTYPAGKAVGELTGIPSPIYECADKNGNIFVASADGSSGGLYEYAHGGTQPINFLPLRDAQGCSVDPLTGNLAAVNRSNTVYIYQNAQGTPAQYVDSALHSAQDAAYDSAGNLYLDGLYTNNYFALLELPHGGSNLQDIAVNGYYYNDLGFSPILWDGKYLDVGAVTPIGVTRSVIYRLELSGSAATVVGTVKLAKQAGTYPYPQFWIQGPRIVQASNVHHSSFAVFRYPSGKRTKYVKLDDRYYTWGVTISVAPSHSSVSNEGSK